RPGPVLLLLGRPRRRCLELAPTSNARRPSYMATTMRVVNVSRSTELASHAALADGFISRLRGLLGRDGLEPGSGLVIEPCTSVHMWGMKFALDIVHLDKKGKVLKVLPNLKP